jgi:guanylate kinase
MSKREEFLEKALMFHREYQDATSAIQAMMRENRAVGPEWDVAVSRQITALDAWMELVQEYENFRTES